MIRKVQLLFDYLVYRSYCFYKKFNDKDPLFMSVLVVSTFQTLLMILIFFLGNSFVRYVNEKSNQLTIKVIVVLLYFILIIFNYRFYKENKVFELSRRWEDEDRFKRIKRGWLISGLLLFPIIFIICYGMFK